MSAADLLSCKSLYRFNLQTFQIPQLMYRMKINHGLSFNSTKLMQFWNLPIFPKLIDSHVIPQSQYTLLETTTV